MSENILGLAGVISVIPFSQLREMIKDDESVFTESRLTLSPRPAGFGFIFCYEKGGASTVFIERPGALTEEELNEATRNITKFCTVNTQENYYIYGLAQFNKNQEGTSVNYSEITGVQIFHRLGGDDHLFEHFENTVGTVPRNREGIVDFIQSCATRTTPVVFIYKDRYEGIWLSSSALTGISVCEIDNVVSFSGKLKIIGTMHLEGVKLNRVEISVSKEDPEAWELIQEILKSKEDLLTTKYNGRLFDITFRSIGFFKDKPKWVNAAFLKGLAIEPIRAEKGYKLFSEIGWFN